MYRLCSSFTSPPSLQCFVCFFFDSSLQKFGLGVDLKFYFNQKNDVYECVRMYGASVQPAFRPTVLKYTFRLLSRDDFLL